MVLKTCMLLLISMGIASVHRWCFEPYLEVTPPFEWSTEDKIHIDLAEAKRVFDLNAAVFIDVRSHRSYLGSHISGALNIPFAEAQMRTREALAHLNRDTPIVTYCSGGSCQASVKMAMFLADVLEYSNVRAFHSGWNAWIDAGYPTTFGKSP